MGGPNMAPDSDTLDAPVDDTDSAPEPPKKRGRKAGVQNKFTVEMKELIQQRGKPVELLCDVARGVKIRIGPQAGPGEPKYAYPSLSERTAAAKILIGKLVPDMKVTEVTGADGERLVPGSSEDKSDLDTARAIAFLLNKAARDLD